MWLLGLKGLKERGGKTWPFTSSSVRSNATSWDSYIIVRISFVDLIWNFCNWLVHTYSTLSKTIFCASVRFNLAVNPVKYSFLLSQFSHVTCAQSFLTVTTETTTSKFCCFNWIESTIMEKKKKKVKNVYSFCWNFGQKISKKNRDEEGGLSRIFLLLFHDRCSFGTITLSDARRRNRARKLWELQFIFFYFVGSCFKERKQSFRLQHRWRFGSCQSPLRHGRTRNIYLQGECKTEVLLRQHDRARKRPDRSSGRGKLIFLLSRQLFNTIFISWNGNEQSLWYESKELKSKNSHWLFFPINSHSDLGRAVFFYCVFTSAKVWGKSGAWSRVSAAA